MRALVTSVLLGIILAAASVLIFVYEGPFLRNFVTKSVQLVPTTELYRDWLNPPFDIYMKFYIYTLRNGEEFENGSKPLLEEIGPFVYKEVRIKEDIRDNMNYTISYKDRRYYTFVPEMSPYQLKYPITTVNIAAMTLLNFIQHSPQIAHSAINEIFKLTGETLLVTKSAEEILWGYQDNFLAEVKKLLPSLVPSDQVGFFIGQNDTIYGNYTIYTGVDDISKLGVIERYNRRTSVNNWPTKYANMINGTDGSLSPPFINKNERQYAFQSTLCRSLYGEYNGTRSMKNNIEVYAIAANEYVFANASINPENEGFCTPLGNCLPSGLFNMSVCMNLGGIALPIVMSNPHFLFGDESVINNVEGLSPPDINIHNTVVYGDPLTGIELAAHQRLQLNLNVINDSKIDTAKNIRQMFYPLMWLDECFEADNATLDNYYHHVKVPIMAINAVKYTLACVSGALLIVPMVVLIVQAIKKKRLRNNQANSTDDTATNWISNETTPLIS